MTDKKITRVKRRRDESLQSYIDRQHKLDELLKAEAEEEKRRRFREEFKEPPETALVIVFCGIATVIAVMLIRGDIKFNQKTADVPHTKPYETVIDDNEIRRQEAARARETESRNRILRDEAVNNKCHSTEFFNTPECQAYVNGIPGSTGKVPIP
jgi:hypothetical protein